MFLRIAPRTLRATSTLQLPRAFTLVELLVVIGIIALLISVLMPALVAARVASKRTQCASNMRQIYMADIMYASTFKNALVNVDTAGLPPAAVDAIVPNTATYTSWPDALSPYIANNKAVFDCTAVEEPRTVSLGQDRLLGIGLNHISLSYSVFWSLKNFKLTDMRKPSDSVLFADSGKISNFTEKDPDKWKEVTGLQFVYFLTPDHPDYAANNPHRIIARHGKYAVCCFADGHVESTQVSKIGLQFYPGVTASGTLARGDKILGVGNDAYDIRWMWDRF